MSIAGFLSSLATIFAMIIAYKSYRNWMYQITHTEQFQTDKLVVDKLNIIHDTCFTFADMDGFRLEQIIYDFKDNTRNLDSEALYDDAQLELEWKECASRQQTCVNISLFLDFKRNVLRNSVSIFSSHEDIPKEILDYEKALKLYIQVATRVCHNKTKPSLFLLNSWPYIDNDSTIRIGDLGVDGELFKELDSSYRAVKLFYRNRWHIS